MATVTGNSPEREQRIISLMLDRLAFRYERRVSREIRRAMRDGAKLVSSGASMQYAEGEHKQKIERILKAYWNDASAMIYKHLWGGEKSVFGHLVKKEFAVQPTVTADRIAAEFIAKYGGDKITQISDTTMLDIRNIVADGIKAGMTEREIAKEIRKIAPTKSASRAQTIARTEGHAASMFTAQESAGATGIQFEREWVSAGGDRTREPHRAANGQKVGMNEPFTVDGEQLMYPGDPSGSAGNVVNCRCITIYSPVE